jgi:hypothetical protein
LFRWLLYTRLTGKNTTVTTLTPKENHILVSKGS